MSRKVDPKEISINVDQMELVYRYYWNIPTIQMCRNTIRQHLFGNGIEFSGKNNQQKNLFSQKIMEDYWLPFCEDALDQAICYGFVTWRTRKIGDTIVPIVCLKNTYKVKLKEDEGNVEYFVYNNKDKENELIKNAHVYDEFGYKPLVDGTLMSIVNTIIPDIQYYMTMLNCQVMLEKKRVKPPIITQLSDRKGVGGTGENEGIDYDFYADADIAEAEEDAKFKRNRQAVKALKEQQKLYDDFFEPNQIPDEISAPTILDQMVPLPAGQHLASLPIQQGRNDLPAILKQLQDTICGVLGVPKSMIMSDTPHKSDAVGTHQIFQMTIVWWKRQISEMCQMIYNIINAKEITERVSNKLNKRKERIQGDVYMTTKNLQSSITFPVTPFISNDQLYDLYTQGVIDWKTYCTYISRNTSIPMDTIPPEPLKDKEKKQLLGINTEPRASVLREKGGQEEARTKTPEEKEEEKKEEQNDAAPPKDEDKNVSKDPKDPKEKPKDPKEKPKDPKKNTDKVKNAVGKKRKKMESNKNDSKNKKNK